MSANVRVPTAELTSEKICHTIRSLTLVSVPTQREICETFFDFEPISQQNKAGNGIGKTGEHRTHPNLNAAP